MEIPGVASLTFLRAAMNAQRKAHGKGDISIPDFMRTVRTEAEKLSMSMDMLKRPVNTGYSGGEKKRHEVLQMALLQPTLCILDETDSGLDIDAIRIAADGVNRLRSPDRAMVVITHYQRLLNYIVPMSCTSWRAGKFCTRAARSLPWSWKKQATRLIAPKRPKGRR